MKGRMIVKRCTRCKKDKPLSEFHKDKKTKDGHAFWCRVCVSEYHANYYIENREKVLSRTAKYGAEHAEEKRINNAKYYKKYAEKNREYHLQNKYGLSANQYNEMFKLQNGVCAICGEAPENSKPLYVDHNHITGEIRGLLCIKCNAGLGFFQDSPEILQRALEYIMEGENKNDN